jgi:hypothetical protein
LVTKTIGFVTVGITIVVTKREKKKGGYKNKTVTKKRLQKGVFPPAAFLVVLCKP